MRLSLLVGSIALVSSPAFATDQIDGHWITQDRKAEVTIAPCGKTRCGRISKILAPTPKGPPHDDNNPNKSLRNRPILGLEVLSGFTANGDQWRGHIYSPQEGKTYRAILSRDESGQLKVKGCIAIFCKTQIWTRAR